MDSHRVEFLKKWNIINGRLDWSMCTTLQEGECIFKDKKIGNERYKVKRCPGGRTVECRTMNAVTYWNQIQDGLV